MKPIYVAALALCFGAGVLHAEFSPNGGMMRYPDISGDSIVFVYGQQLWIVSKEGGLASTLAQPFSDLASPKFSPDGKTVAFMANYDGNSDLYTIPVSGGVPYRVTHHPHRESLCGWTPDGKALIFSIRGFGDHPVSEELYRVPVEGGLPEKLPVPYGANGSLSDDGQWLAYTPFARDFRTWKRYRGGMASDIWLVHMEKSESKQLSTWEGTDSFPMWHGSTLYYFSDAGPHHRLNLWRVDPATLEHQQVTQFAEWDVKFPSIGPDAIVFQLGSHLKKLDLSTLEVHEVTVTVPGDRVTVKERLVDAAPFLVSAGISTTGQRVILEARGDLWSVPATEGVVLNLTSSDTVMDRSPAWSPNKDMVCFFSDRDGSYDLYEIAVNGTGQPVRLTQLKARFLYQNQYSPDGKSISMWNRAGELILVDRANKTHRVVDRDPRLNRDNGSWSADSRYFAYARGNEDHFMSSLWVYDVKTDTKTAITDSFFHHDEPVFDREGKYLFFTSNRHWEHPQYEDLGSTWAYTKTGQLFVLPLKADTVSPFAPKNDQEEQPEADAKKEDDGGKDKKKGKKDQKEDAKDKEDSVVVTIDFEGIRQRAIPLPVDPGSFFNLEVNDKGHLIYCQGTYGERTSSVALFDLKGEEQKAEEVIDEVSAFDISADGKKILVMKGSQLAVLDAQPKQSIKKPVPVKDLMVLVQPRNEWRQMFWEAWRFYRDFFYDPQMHGVDWVAVGNHYAPMLDDCVSRSDLSYLIREMISELNVGHAYYYPGPEEGKGPKVHTGMLGVDWALVDGAYRIEEIVRGGDWDTDAMGPLSQPGVKVSKGDFLVAVNGKPLNTQKDPWAAFAGLAGKTVRLTFSKTAKGEQPWEVQVQLMESEQGLRYRRWVERNRQKVDAASKGQVGYLYVPNTGIRGQNELIRQFYGQTGKKALIIDERWNGGGQIPTRFIELLNRPVANFWALRDGDDWIWPYDSHQGPKCMLINGMAGSGGDYFPFWFKQTELGPLIGRRTWGGLVGISSEPPLMDGAGVTTPSFAFYEKDGTWGIEGHGVDPDIEVMDDPALMREGGDPQLDRAVAEMLKALETQAFVKPPRPPYPDRSKMGIEDKDK